MKGHAAMAAICIKDSDLEIANFLNAVKAFVLQVRNEQRDSGGNDSTVTTRKRTKCILSIWTL